MMRLKRILSRVLGSRVYAVRSFAQEGEDLVLRRVLGSKASGFYVDVGAHHPYRFSNTQLFYERGWRGINIEPNPDVQGDFRSARPRDITLQLGVSNQRATLRYHLFDDPALNTFDAELAKSRERDTPYRISGTLEVPVEPLAEILAKHLPPGTAIDFLSIDVEGHDFAVLQSNDWERFRPDWVLVEALGTTLEEQLDSELGRFMKAKGYVLAAKTSNTLFFRKKAS